MNAKALALPKRGSYRDMVSWWSVLVFCAVLALVATVTSRVVLVNADNFTDIFNTNSFRGSFEWFKKLDWIGMVVQAVISVFSLVGVSLIVIRIMTSMLYLSARGLWEEVHDLKQSGGESEMYDFGLVNMAKSWAKGKAGTGLDAIIGAVLVLLPDVKRYSDFGEKSGQNFDEDTTMTQYILKILLPTVLSVFFLAMGFNGTLVQGLAVTVDAMGTAADKVVSVNYAGFVEDLVNSGSGYRFTFSADGTEYGKLKQSVAKDLYGRIVSNARGAETSQLIAMGQALEAEINTNFDTWISNSTQISSQISGYVGGGSYDAQYDRYYSYLGYDIVANSSNVEATGSGLLALDAIMTFKGVGMSTSENAQKTYYHIYIKQTNSFDGSYFNFDETT